MKTDPAIDPNALFTRIVNSIISLRWIARRPKLGFFLSEFLYFGFKQVAGFDRKDGNLVIRFHDGSTLDANDVVLSYAVQWDAANPLHVGNTGAFSYFSALWGPFLNAPPAE